jgi:mono/diheme cytochrome c family protein
MKSKLFFAGLVGFVLGLPCVPAAALISGWPARVPATPHAQPPGHEARSATSVARELLAANASPLSNPLTASSKTLADALNLYRNNCAGCHGVPGAPSRWGTRGFSPPAPQFADRPPTLSDSEMFVVIKKGIPNSGMAGWEVLLADQDIWRLATFLGRLRELPQPVEALWKG